MFIDTILAIGLFTTVLIVFMIIKSSFKVSFKIWLSFIFALVFIYLLLIFSKRNDLGLLFKLCFWASNSVAYLVGPSVLLFVKSLFKPNKNIWLFYILHAIPFIAHLILITIPFSNFTEPDSLSAYLKIVYYNWSWFMLFENVYLTAYLLFAFYIFIHRSASPKYDYSIEPTSSSLFWIRNLLICFSFIVVVDLLVILYQILFKDTSVNRSTITLMTISVSFVYLVIISLMNFNILDSIGNTKEKKLVLSSNASRDLLLHVNSEEIEGLKTQLHEIMGTQQLFLDNALTLRKLAGVLNLKEKTLSFMLNKKMNTTFYNLINEYRLNYAIQKMKEDKFRNYSIHGIAVESGFKSKTTFYRVFKRKMNMTPKQYLELHA